MFVWVFFWWREGYSQKKKGFASFSLRLMSFLCVIIESTYKVETKTIAVDYSQADIYPKIEKGLAGLEIGILGKLKKILSKHSLERNTALLSES